MPIQNNTAKPSKIHWTYTGWCENSARWKLYKRVRSRGRGTWACLAHALQCLCDLSLVMLFGHRHPVVSTRNFYWDGTGWCENSTRWKLWKRVQSRGHGAWACLAHALQCLCDGRACCPPRALQLVICRSWGVTGTVTLLLQLVIFTGMARVGVKIPQDGNRTNVYGHMAAVREHLWRTVCSVYATSARVVHPVSCNS